MVLSKESAVQNWIKGRGRGVDGQMSQSKIERGDGESKGTYHGVREHGARRKATNHARLSITYTGRR